MLARAQRSPVTLHRCPAERSAFATELVACAVAISANSARHDRGIRADVRRSFAISVTAFSTSISVANRWRLREPQHRLWTALGRRDAGCSLRRVLHVRAAHRRVHGRPKGSGLSCLVHETIPRPETILAPTRPLSAENSILPSVSVRTPLQVAGRYLQSEPSAVRAGRRRARTLEDQGAVHVPSVPTMKLTFIFPSTRGRSDERILKNASASGG